MALKRGFAAAWRLACALSQLVRSDQPVSGMARNEALVMLRRAEALVRRGLFILALRLKSAPQRPFTEGMRVQIEMVSRIAQRPQIERFQLSEPLISLPVLARPKGPRIRVLTPDRWAFELGPSGEPEKAENQDRLEVRFQALQAALDQPQSAARRMARWLARQARKAKHGPARRQPLRLGAPPHLGKSRRLSDPASVDALLHLHHYALTSFEAADTG